MKPVIYQLVVRTFGNTNVANRPNGNIATNGCGTFADIDATAIASLRDLGVTHIWLTGCIRQATLTDYSAIGLPADAPDIVKGIAGSFYAIRDYYDVCPDYAVPPETRMAEFEALVGRIHAAGLRVVIDFVPNHVSRAYASDLRPQETLGRNDDKTRFFDPQNHFFYLVDPPGQALRLSKPDDWDPSGVRFTRAYLPEDGSPGHPPRASGDNLTSPDPSATNWYETVKLNYGFDFVTGARAFAPVPATWTSMDKILAYWQTKGVDGFRCDFAHYVPAEAWRYLIGRARARKPAYVFAEAYPGRPEDPVGSQEELVAAGFDAVYHYQAYNALKGLYLGEGIARYDTELKGLPDDLRGHLVGYLENHDERRVASRIVGGHGEGDSGFGSAAAGYQLAPLQFLAAPGPVLMLNGQEVGEPGDGQEGFGGDDGRTTIYDYWTMPEFAKWVNGHRYDGGGLVEDQRRLRKFYAALLKLCQSPSVRGSGYWSLLYVNNPDRFGDTPGGVYSFARFDPASGELLLVAANIRVVGDAIGRLRLPRDLMDKAGMAQDLAVDLVLDRDGATQQRMGRLTRDELDQAGFEVSIANQTSHVYRIGPA